MTLKKYLESTPIYDEEGQMIFLQDKDGNLVHFLDVRGWGHIQHLFKKDGKIDMREAAKFQDEIGRFVVEAIKDKIKTL